MLSLTLLFSDGGGSGVSQMSFSTDGVSYTSPAAYGTSATFVLTGPDGLYTVYTRVTDVAGNSVVVTRSVRLDRTGIARLPVAPAVFLV